MELMNSMIIMLSVLLSVAFYTLMERKMISMTQNRKGPNKVLMIGIIQPMADGLKLLSKEENLNLKSNMMIYLVSPILNLICSIFMWVVYPTVLELKFMKMSLLFIVSCMTFNVISIMMMSWASNSNYAAIGMIRTISQLISYEINFLMMIIMMMNLSNQMNLSSMHSVQKYFPLALIMAPMVGMWLITITAETSRTPFDFSEGESELISGFNIEYSSKSFVFLFLAEYTSIMLMSLITSALFSSVNMMNILFYIVYIMTCVYFIWARISFPRFRYDKLMKLNWIQILPVITCLLFISFSMKMYCAMKS